MSLKNRFIRLFFLLTANVLLASEVPANDVINKLGNGWYEAVGYQNLYEYSEKEGLKKAIALAQEAALQTHSGINIKSSSTRLFQESNTQVQLDQFFQITSFLSEGIITDSDLLQHKIIEFESQRYMKAHIKVRVQKLEGKPDPNFKLEAHLDRTVYNEGDAITIKAVSSKDCHLYVFNISSNDTVYVLLPNQYLEDNFIKKSQEIKIPPEKSGISYAAGLLPDRESDQKLIKLLAIQDKKLEDFDITLGKKSMALQSFYRMLLDLNQNQISEIDLMFTVQKKP